MAFYKNADRVKQKTTTTGTGAYVFSASLTGYVDFSDVTNGIGPNNFCTYAVFNGSDYEIGEGTVAANGLGISRDLIIESSNANAAVNWPAGQKDIFVTLSAKKPRLFGLEVDSLNGGPLAGFRNLIDNGDFSINQRVATTAANNVYAHDRWYVLTSTGSVTISQLTDVADGLPTMVRLTQPDATAKRIAYAQVFEGKRCKHLRGKKATFHFDGLRCSASQPIRFAVLEWIGTEDIVTRDVVNSWTNGTFTAGQFFKAANIIVSGTVAKTPAAATLTDSTALTVQLGSTFNNIIVMAWTEGTLAQGGTLDLGNAQFEVGEDATLYERIDFATLLSRCSRYYNKSVELSVGPNVVVSEGQLIVFFQTFTGTQALTISLPVRMRTLPTIRFYDGHGNVGACAYYTGVWVPNSPLTASTISDWMFSIRPAFTSMQYIAFNFSADAEIGI